jgi:hypothetical protein
VEEVVSVPEAVVEVETLDTHRGGLEDVVGRPDGSFGGVTGTGHSVAEEISTD